MWFESRVPTPRDMPVVPTRLSSRIDDNFEGIQRIDVLVREGLGWRKINALHLEGGVYDEEARMIALLVTICAHHHAKRATWSGRGKYRAMIWRKVGPERERRVVTFDVRPEDDGRKRSRKLPNYKNPRRTLAAAWQMFAEFAAETMQRSLDQMEEMDRILRQRRVTQLDELGTLAALYEQGLRLQSEAGRQQAEARVQRALARAKARHDAKVWAEVGPMIDGVLSAVRERVFGPAESPGSSAAAPRGQPAPVGSPGQ